MFIEHAEEEASFILSLVRVISGVSRSGHYDLNFSHREGRLLEVAPVLTQDNLACVRVTLPCGV